MAKKTLMLVGDLGEVRLAGATYAEIAMDAAVPRADATRPWVLSDAPTRA